LHDQAAGAAGAADEFAHMQGNARTWPFPLKSARPLAAEFKPDMLLTA
jgi:hypothetical protein